MNGRAGMGHPTGDPKSKQPMTFITAKWGETVKRRKKEEGVKGGLRVGST